MLAPPRTAFLSTSKARSVDAHRAINAWHQLDHRPENLALPGVAYGERFVHSPALAGRSARDGSFADFDYANLYWFDDPVEPAIEVWADLAEQTLREGRRADVDLVERGYMDFFRQVGRACSPGLRRLDPRALYYRPVTGVIMCVSSLPADLSRTGRQAHHSRELDELLPAVAEVAGVAVAWSLESDPTLAPAAWRAREAASGTAEGEIVRLLWIATEVDPPGDVLARLVDGPTALATRAPGEAGSLQFLGALETITPWQWSWFDEEGTS